MFCVHEHTQHWVIVIFKCVHALEFAKVKNTVLTVVHIGTSNSLAVGLTL